MKSRILKGLRNPNLAAKYVMRKAAEGITDPLVRNEHLYQRIGREELLELAIKRGGKVIQPKKAREISFDPPIYEEPKATKIQEATGPIHFDAPFVCEIRDVTLRGPLALATIEGRKLITEKEADRGDLLSRAIGYDISEVVSSAGNRPHQHYNIATPLVGSMSHTFYHWFADYFVRLQWLIHYTNVTGEFPTLLVPENQPSWLSESLSLVDYPQEYIEKWKGGIATVDRLVIPSSRRQHSEVWKHEFEHYDPAAFAWLREQLSDATEDINRDWPSAVIISREDANSRRMINQNSVVESLDEYDAESFVLSELSLTEQIDLFKQADLVVGAHGAGLLNIAYGESLSVVELYGSLLRPLFYSLAEGQEFKYAVVKGEESGDDIIVDLNKLKHAVNAVT